MSARVRFASPEEWERVRELRLRALADAPDAFSATLESERDAPESGWRSMVTGWEGATNAMAIAEVDGEWVGMAVGMRKTDAPEAHLFAEPGRTLVIGDRCSIGAEVFVHGPVVLGPDVSLNPRVSLDGGAKGIRIGEGTRVATGATIYAFDHGMAPDRTIRSQPVRSRGVDIGAQDVLLHLAARRRRQRVHQLEPLGELATRQLARLEKPHQLVQRRRT